MGTATAVHPEGSRYAAPVVYLAGAWMRSGLWRGVATYMAHRGWAGFLFDPGAAGGVAARARVLGEWVGGLGAPPVVVAHDAGAVIAAAAAQTAAIRALVLVAPLVPGAAGTHAVAWSPGLAWALLRGRPVPPPGGQLGAAFFAGIEPGARDAVPESPRLLGDLARRRAIAPAVVPPPTLVVRGALDPVVSRADAERWAGDFAGELVEIPDRGHWPMAGPQSSELVHRVHRWLVRRLGEELLELYAEAMADREADDA